MVCLVLLLLKGQSSAAPEVCHLQTQHYVMPEGHNVCSHIVVICRFTVYSAFVIDLSKLEVSMAVPSSTFVLSMLFTAAICRPVFDHDRHRAHFEHNHTLVHHRVPLPRVAWVVTAHPSALESFNNSYAETVSSLNCYALQHGISFFYEPLQLQVRSYLVVNSHAC